MVALENKANAIQEVYLGMKRRLLIATMVHQPPILILLSHSWC